MQLRDGYSISPRLSRILAGAGDDIWNFIKGAQGDAVLAAWARTLAVRQAAQRGLTGMESPPQRGPSEALASVLVWEALIQLAGMGYVDIANMLGLCLAGV